MNTQTIIPIVIVLLVVITIGFIVIASAVQIRSRRLKMKFGPEYAYTLDKLGDRKTAEADLQERESRVTDLDLHPLGESEKNRYHREWIDVQASFVEHPGDAVDKANRLITEVMIARGFPVEDFDQRSADLSVIYPDQVPGYREANSITIKSHNNGASTEELRQALVNYHSLFDELLSFEQTPEKELAVQNE